MALTDIPTVRPSSGTIFLIALPIVIYIFLHTAEKQ